MFVDNQLFVTLDSSGDNKFGDKIQYKFGDKIQYKFGDKIQYNKT
jgi:hypothetical protein